MLFFLLSLASVGVITTEQVFTYECKNDNCKKTILVDGIPHQGLDVCMLLCRAPIWPRPTSLAHTKEIVYLDKEKVYFKLEPSPLPDYLETSWDSFTALFPTTTEEAEGSKVEIQLSIPEGSTLDVYTLDTAAEAYSLNLTKGEDGVLVTIHTTAGIGAVRALQTLSQLIVVEEDTGRIASLQEVYITDEPQFKWRGLSVDTSRNFISTDKIKEIISGLAAAKMNTFHWHMTDSHSFPFGSTLQPRMPKYGAYASTLTYSKAEVTEIVEFGRTRGVRVMPELDAPAHVGYGWQWGSQEGVGELLSCFEKTPWENYCYEPPCGQLNILNDKVYDILESIYSEWVELFQLNSGDKYFHMGGDEVKASCWREDDNFQNLLKQKHADLSAEDDATYYKLWGDFQRTALARYNGALEEGGKGPKIILWNSHLTQEENLGQLDPATYTIQFWGAPQENEAFQAELENILRKGFDVIMSNYNDLYLDCGFGPWVGQGPNNWCSPYKSWIGMFEADVRKFVTDTYGSEGDLQKQIIGGETAIWTEQTSDGDIMQRVFPRTWALAERLWTNPDSSVEAGELGSWEEAEVRLAHFAKLMQKRGIMSNTFKPQFCQQNTGACVLPRTTNSSRSKPIQVVFIVLLYSLITLLR